MISVASKSAWSKAQLQAKIHQLHLQIIKVGSLPAPKTGIATSITVHAELISLCQTRQFSEELGKLLKSCVIAISHDVKVALEQCMLGANKKILAWSWLDILHVNSQSLCKLNATPAIVCLCFATSASAKRFSVQKMHVTRTNFRDRG